MVKWTEPNQRNLNWLNFPWWPSGTISDAGLYITRCGNKEMWHRDRAQPIHQEENEWNALSFCICTMTLTRVVKESIKISRKKKSETLKLSV